MTTASIVRRTSLFVRDMQRAVAFYTSVFGLSVYHERDLDIGRVPDFPVDLERPEGPMRLVILRGQDPLVGMIGLMHVAGLPAVGETQPRLGYGNAALVLSTSDAEHAASQIEACGGKLLMPLTTARNIGDAAGDMVPARLFMALDPDGYFLEVFEPL